MAIKLETQNLSAWFGRKQILKDVSMAFEEKRITALVGPSGCGKSTFIRCLNRMHELNQGARVEGKVLLEGADIYDLDPMEVRRKIGMVFQKPNPFPNMSISENVIAGIKLSGEKRKADLDGVAERALKSVGLYDEVKDDLKRSGASLSGGQQQRLCIARALAMEPEMILMDEPTSSLDPASTSRIEDLIRKLKSEITVIIITHNVAQAARISDMTAFLYLGGLIEYGETKEFFESPKSPITERYITGRFG